MNIIIGKTSHDLFIQGEVYDCVIRIDHHTYYKVYGNEFDLSCTYEEFRQNFILKKDK